ncbi:L-ribulose-5-phosphate 3-epimerase UlaE [Blautia producta]|uniref:L-ribulose-5-phosphate 3-epimerase UlaE n=1 Tax=Blautia producta TaxID=33035 RepID=A0A4P6LXL6_9FIRM|nr:TIM barrel protein [Blautia producta]QBE96642.1 L-ribulose-5-phosphate 3-epimerase UlaE [Blautia producta]
MKIIPSVLNWSYHRQFWNRWDVYLDAYIDKVAALKEKYQISEMGIDIGMASGQDAFRSHDKGYLTDVKERLVEKGLHPIPIVGSLEIHADNSIVQTSLDEMACVMEEALVLGADRVQFYHNLHGRLSREKAVRVYHQAAGVLEKTAAGMGLTCSSEEYCGLNGNEIYLALKDTPHVGLLNDVGNWLILGEDPIAATQKFIDITSHVHLKDYVFDDGVWRSVPFGEGIIDVKKALEILRQAPGNKILYAAFETDLDTGDEDEAMDTCFRYFLDWEKNRL